jgi:hypothetical protein
MNERRKQMKLFECLILGLVGFICVYAIVDRMCRCLENYGMAKYTAEALKKGVELNKK